MLVLDLISLILQNSMHSQVLSALIALDSIICIKRVFAEERVLKGNACLSAG